jgi:hypothetical protein
MPRWTRGEAEVEQLVARGELERVSGAAADGTPLLEQARKTAATAAGLVSSDAYSAYVLAYDAARFACIALLAQQGLRATTSGGHYAVEQAVRAQFGDGFRPFGALRRRRNELEYPHLPADTATSEEAEQAAGTAQRLIGAAGTLLSQLSFFSQEQELPGTTRRLVPRRRPKRGGPVALTRQPAMSAVPTLGSPGRPVPGRPGGAGSCWWLVTPSLCMAR